MNSQTTQEEIQLAQATNDIEAVMNAFKNYRPASPPPPSENEQTWTPGPELVVGPFQIVTICNPNTGQSEEAIQIPIPTPPGQPQQYRIETDTFSFIVADTETSHQG